MKKYVLLYLTFLLPICLCAQNRITKSLVQKKFNDSRVKLQNGKFTIPSDTSWYFNNLDSVYYKQDTIIAIRYKSSKHKDMCESVHWTFHRKNHFILGKSWLCQEPTRGSATKYPEDYFSITVYNVENETIFDVLRYDRMIMESFIVADVEENQEYIKLKLHRRFNGLAN